MIIFHFVMKAIRCIYLFQATVFILMIFLISPLAFGADPSKEREADPADKQIQIIADKLIANNEDKYAEFTGNVRVIQGNLAITADNLKIYFEGDLLNANKQISGKENIKSIVASGNVKIISEEYTAVTNQATYDMETKILVLTGENSKVTSGKNSITGSKITLFQKDGQIKVEGSSDKRVKVEFYSNENVSDVSVGQDAGENVKQPLPKIPSETPHEAPAKSLPQTEVE